MNHLSFFYNSDDYNNRTSPYTGQLLVDYRDARKDIEEGNFEDWTDWEEVKKKMFTSDGKAKVCIRK